MAKSDTTYRLKQPFVDAGRTIEEVSIRPLRLGDLREFEISLSGKGDGAWKVDLSAEHLLGVAGRVLGWDPGQIDKLALEDALAIGALIAKGFPGFSA